MGFRFRKSFTVLPGLRINLSRRGVSANVGVRGASVSVNSRGTFVNAGIPGSGLGYRERISGGDNGATPSPAQEQPQRSGLPLLVVIIVTAIFVIIAVVAGL
jgi:hypothetical protein